MFSNILKVFYFTFVWVKFGARNWKNKNKFEENSRGIEKKLREREIKSKRKNISKFKKKWRPSSLQIIFSRIFNNFLGIINIFFINLSKKVARIP